MKTSISTAFSAAFIALVVFTVTPTSTLRAQAFCQGTACASLPITTAQLDGLAANLKFQYGDLLANDMATASLAGNLLGLPIGSVTLDGTYTGGIGLGVGFETPYNIFVVTEYGSLSGIESGGYSLNPKFFLGANLGRALGKSEDDRLGPFYWNRLEVYGSFFNRTVSTGNGVKFSAGDAFVFNEQQALQAGGSLDLAQGFTIDPAKGIKFTDQNSIALSSQGLEARYALIKGETPLLFGFIRFLGVSVGVGFYKSAADLEVIQGSTDLDINLGSAGTLVWNSGGIASYRLRMRSIPLEVRSGISIWKFLRLTASGGISFNSGKVSLSYLRYGNAYVRDTSLFSLLGSTSDSVLGIAITADSKIKGHTFFAKPGVEFSFPYFKLTFEGLLTRESEGIDIGMRVEF